MKIVIGTLNPIKVSAARHALHAVYGIRHTSDCVHPVSLSIHMPDQPMTMEDTLMGARRRAVHSALVQDAELGIGMEGGLALIDDEWFCVSWASVANRLGEIKSAMGPAVYVPPQIMSLVHDGMELGAADDAYFGLTNSKQSGGLIGTITHGLFNREQTFSTAVLTALCSMNSYWSKKENAL